jgi:hypothetical protein
VLGPLQGLLRWPVGTTAQLDTWLLYATAIATGGWLLAWIGARALRLPVILGVSAAAQALLLLGPPLPLTDVFNYIFYGRMQALYGLNPFRATPMSALGDPVFGLSNWHSLRSPYGPLFTWAFAGLGHLSPAAALWSWKIILFACGVALVAVTASVARLLGRSPARAAALVGLSPVLLIAEVGGEHQDVPAVLCVVAAAWCLLRARERAAPGHLEAAAGALVVAAAAIKPSMAIVAPVILLGARSRLWALAGLAAAGAATALVVLVVYGGATPDITTQAALVTPLSVPNLLGLAGGHGGADPQVRAIARDVLVAVAVAASVMVALRRRLAPAALAIVLVAAVLALPWVMPWYLVWALPFLAVARPSVGVPVAAVIAVWLFAGGVPQEVSLLHWAGYFPTRHPTGLANHLLLERLVQ